MDRTLLNQVTQQLQPASNDFGTPAGQTDKPQSEDHLSAINQIFELFRFNYHNQFLKAFPDLDTLNMAKRLWANLLAEYASPVILQAAEQAVKESSFLPTVHEVTKRCDNASCLGLPSAYAAYVEACRATSPKHLFNWSHPAVYFAARASDWYLLATSPKSQAFPVFERNYEYLLQRVKSGEKLEIDISKAIPEQIETPLGPAEKKQQLAQLRKTLSV